MSSALSTYGANAALAALLVRSGLYLACHTSDPGAAADPLTTEVDSGGYYRQPVSFAPASSRTTLTTNNQTFLMPSTTVTYLAVWTAAGGGSYVVAWQLPGAGLTAQADGSLVVMAGDLALSL